MLVYVGVYTKSRNVGSKNGPWDVLGGIFFVIQAFLRRHYGAGGASRKRRRTLWIRVPSFSCASLPISLFGSRQSVQDTSYSTERRKKAGEVVQARFLMVQCGSVLYIPGL